LPKAKQAEQMELDFVRFRADTGSHDLAIDLSAETMWATQAEIADLFRVSVATVAKQLAAIYAEGELSPDATVRQMAPAGQTVGDRYNLDAILSVGYRINAVKATAFRQWATRTLRSLVIDGYLLDEARLRSDAQARDTLAARLRAIRAEETSIYESVRAFFAACATDYAADSDAAHSFAQRLEDKFAYAVTGETPSDLILERADHDKPDMGLRRFSGPLPSMDEARIAQNYLDKHELFVMHSLCEQFLLLVQQKAARRQPMTMAQLNDALDELLRLNDYPVLPRHKNFHAARAIRHAQAEYARFAMRARRTG
jgi:hypothetical protein